MENLTDHFSLKQFKDRLKAEQINMAFHGMLSQDVLYLIAQSLKNSPHSSVISKRLFAMVIELAQNIHHYSAQKEFSQKDERMVGVGVIALGQSDEHYLVHSGNLVETEHTPAIIHRCNHINQLDSEGLKAYYVEQRKLPQREGKPGANLGLIDMVRKSGNPVEVSVDTVDQQHSFLVLSVKINKTLVI